MNSYLRSGVQLDKYLEKPLQRNNMINRM